MNLYKHQQDAINFAVGNAGRAALFHEPGLGKTRTSLEIFKHFRAAEPTLRMLVVCPLSLINAAWGEDTKKFTDFFYMPFNDLTPGDVYDGMKRKPDIIGINFESLITAKRLAEVKRLLLSGPFMLVVDESSRMKSNKSVTTKTLLALARLAKYRMVASGTPCPNSELELWGQMKFVNNDLLHDSFYAFRNTYFHLGRGRQVMHVPQGKVMTRGMMRELLGSGWKYQITDEMRERLMEKIKPFVHWVKKSDALDLPEKIDELREVRLNPNEKRMYKEMEKLLITEVKGTAVTAEVALAKLMKLRQASAGFLYDEEHNALRPGKSSKMRELEDTLEDLGNQQVIIWVQFTEEVAAIGRLITEMGRSFTTLHGATEDKDASIKAFQSNSVQYLIAHPRSAGHGLTFVNCSAAVYFSLDYSYEAHEQSRDRIHRIGQVNKCLYIYLLAKDTIDTAVLQVLRRKKSLQELVYEIMKKG